MTSKTNKAKKVFLIAFALMLVGASAQLFAKSAADINAGVKVALETLKSKVGVEKVNRAYGILVFPEVYKGGVGFGGEYGEGALLRGGKTMGYYSTVSASVGWQLGGQKKTVIYLFNTKEAYDKFLNSDGWKAGVDASVAVLSFGVGAEVDTNYQNDQPVEAFILDQKGLMYDLSLEGTKISTIKR